MRSRIGAKAERALPSAGATTAVLTAASAALVFALRDDLILGMIRGGRYDRFLALALDALPPALAGFALLVAGWTAAAWTRPAARRSLVFLLVAIVGAFAWSARSEGSRAASWPLIMADDFPSYYFAAEAFAAGESPYEPLGPRARTELTEGVADLHARLGLPAPRRPLARAVFPYLYPPFAALAIAPLTSTSYFVAQHLWALLQIAALALLMTLAASRAERAGPLLVVALILALGYEPLVNNAETGQVNLLVALLAWGAYALDARGRVLLAALCLGLAVQIKASPLLLLAYFIVRARFRTAVASVLVVAALFGLTWGADGGAMVRTFLTEVAPQVSHVTKLVLPSELAPEALVLSNSPDPVRTFRDYPDVRVYNQAPVAFAGMLASHLGASGHAAVRATQGVLALMWASTLALAWRTRRSSGLLSFSCATVLVLLSSPLLWQHHLVWMVAPALAITARGARSALGRAGATLAAVGFLLTAHDLGYDAFGLVRDVRIVADTLPWSYTQLGGLVLIWLGLFVAGVGEVHDRAPVGAATPSDEPDRETWSW